MARRVYKFGGASVCSADGVKNVCKIVSECEDDLLIVVSAMGKTTNAMEVVLDAFMEQRTADALSALGVSREYHRAIIAELFDNDGELAACEELFAQLQSLIECNIPNKQEYNFWYDRVVSFGELLSTKIIAEYLNHVGLGCRWIDIRRCFITDARHRDANIDLERSKAPMRESVDGATLCISQGFIGATADGETTTLGREGSDYSAAVAAYLLDAESVSIWKDVPGLLSADPRIFDYAVLIPELTYLDAIELAYSGAQIIHPKTIKPLQNRGIKLYVRPFSDSSSMGSVIQESVESKIDVPIIIVKHNQIMISIRPKDFSFVLQDRMLEILQLLESYDVKPNLIQSSAVNLTMAVDRSREIEQVIKRLTDEGFRVKYNGDMELLTIRGYNEELYNKYMEEGEVLLTQKTRRTFRLLRRVSK